MQLEIIMVLSITCAAFVVFCIILLLILLNNTKGSDDTKGRKIPFVSDMFEKQNQDPWNISIMGGGGSMTVREDSLVYGLKKNTTGSESGGIFTSNPYSMFPVDEAQVQFDVYLPMNFPMKPEKDKNLEESFGDSVSANNQTNVRPEGYIIRAKDPFE